MLGKPPGPGDWDRRAKVFGAIPAIVTDNNDPDGFYRVKVRFPTLPNGTESGGESSDWARVCSFAAGADRGMFWLPQVDDEVLIVFEHGDTRRPFVIGSLWNNDAQPPYDNKGDDKDNHVRAMKSRSGSLTEFVDEKGKTKITIKSSAGRTIVIDDTSGSEVVELHDDSSDHVFKLDMAGQKITLESKQGDIFIKAKDKLKLEAEEIVTKAGDMHKMSVGAKFDVTAKSNFSMNSKAGHIEASQELTLKGQLVDINPPGGSGGSANTQPGSGGSEGGGGSGASQSGSGDGGSAQSGGGNAAAGSSSGSENEDQQNEEESTEEHQIEVQLVNALGEPQANVRYEITLPDGTKKTGTSGSDGWIRLSGLTQTGDAQLVLPDIDEAEGGEGEGEGGGGSTTT